MKSLQKHTRNSDTRQWSSGWTFMGYSFWDSCMRIVLSSQNGTNLLSSKSVTILEDEVSIYLAGNKRSESRLFFLSLCFQAALLFWNKPFHAIISRLYLLYLPCLTRLLRRNLTRWMTFRVISGAKVSQNTMKRTTSFRLSQGNPIQMQNFLLNAWRTWLCHHDGSSQLWEWHARTRTA